MTTMRTCPCSDPITFGHMTVCADGGYRQNDPARDEEIREAALEAARAVRMAMTGRADTSVRAAR
jgi:hypothetical protein